MKIYFYLHMFDFYFEFSDSLTDLLINNDFISKITHMYILCICNGQTFIKIDNKFRFYINLSMCETTHMSKMYLSMKSILKNI